ncbi:MAG: hypothetical protein KDJ38_10105 [Gammaproteobacteria bacterium]|nr:hypothetical protein [Gammaproteobacteria bacterium]
MGLLKLHVKSAQSRRYWGVCLFGGAIACCLPGLARSDDSCVAEVESVGLWDADDDTLIYTLSDIDVVDLEYLDSNITFVAEVSACTASVAFVLNGSEVAVENNAPLSMTGDDEGDLHPWEEAASGSYELQVIPYTGTGKSGTAGRALTRHFDVVDEDDCYPTLGEIALFDVVGERKMQVLNRHNTIDSSGLPAEMAIGAAAGSCIQSVTIHVNGVRHRVENSAPYFTDGDDAGDPHPSDIFDVEQLEVRFTPWSEDNEGGIAGDSRTVSIEFTAPRIAHTVSNDIADYLYLSANFADPIRSLKPGPSAYSPEFGDSDYARHGSSVGEDQDEYDSFDDNYYYTVDPDGLRTTLADWKALHGITDRFGSLNADVVNARYVNAYDLGFGRDMYCLETSTFDSRAFPCVVENYQVNGGDTNFVASVAMERVYAESSSGSGRYYTAFFVYDAGGRRINAIDLDGKGSKRVPEACWACHDGGMSRIGSRGGQYLAFDTELFRNFPGAPTVAAQSAQFEALNRIVNRVAEAETRTAYDNDNHVNIKRLIERFEDARHTSELSGAPDSHRRNGQAEIYSRYCRTCHVTQTPFEQPGEGGRDFAYLSYGEDLPSPNGSRGTFNCLLCHQPTNLEQLGSVKGFYSRPTIDTSEAGKFKEVVCGQFDAEAVTLPEKQMPNARETHKRLIEEHTDSGAHGFRSVRSDSVIRTTFGCDSIPDLR